MTETRNNDAPATPHSGLNHTALRTLHAALSAEPPGLRATVAEAASCLAVAFKADTLSPQQVRQMLHLCAPLSRRHWFARNVLVYALPIRSTGKQAWRSWGLLLSTPLGAYQP